MAKKAKQEFYPINSVIYCVHNSYFTRKDHNTTIKVGRVKSYRRYNKEVIPVIKETGSKNEIDPKSYKLTPDFKTAYNWLKDGF
jgi:hypothetical protein